jgi:hypothetical protein
VIVEVVVSAVLDGAVDASPTVVLDADVSDHGGLTSAAPPATKSRSTITSRSTIR